MSGTLYVVGTPIGNLGDISPRALSTLEKADFIAAEDTRVTGKLLNHFGIKNAMVSYHEHNRRQRGEQILLRLAAGESCALVTDAGMPCISDPGEDLIARCHDTGIPVQSVPGPTAFATALALSGMPSGRFTFEGFLTVNKKNRRAHLDGLRGETRTMIFYEAPHKLANTLRDLADTLGDREITLVREATKLHEEVVRTTLAAAAHRYADGGAKGEFVLIVAGLPERADEALPMEMVVQDARRMMEQGLSRSEAAREAAKNTLYKKGDVYKELLP